MAFKKKTFTKKEGNEDLLRIGSFWSREGSDNLSGSLDERNFEAFGNLLEEHGVEGVRIMVFPNKWKKEGTREPDYRLFASPKTEFTGKKSYAKKEVFAEEPTGAASPVPPAEPAAKPVLPWNKKK